MKLKTLRHYEFPTNLWSIVFEREVTQAELPPDWEATLTYLLDTLYPPKKCEFLLSFYRDNLRLDEIGGKHEVCRERVRQVLGQAIRDLRHPTRRWIMTYGLQMAAKLSGISPTANTPLSLFQPPGSPTPQSPLSKLDLSTRAYHYLTSAGISTVEQLLQRKDSDLLRIPNFGLASLRNVKCCLAQYGFLLSSEQPEIPPIDRSLANSADSTLPSPQDEICQLRSMVMDLSTENTRLSSLLATTEGERDRAMMEVRHLQRALAEASLSEGASLAPQETTENQLLP